MSYSDLVHEANVLATRVSVLEQAVPPVIDTYQSMLAEAGMLAGRVTVLEGAVPLPNRIQVSNFRLVGGWRIREPFTRGGLAIDLAANRAWIGGHAQQNEVGEFALPTMGLGVDVSQWPILDKTKVIPQFWEAGHAGGLAYENGELVVSPRIHYDTSPGALTISRMNIATGAVSHHPTMLSKPGFGGGFVKGGAELMLGCGGYESGQGSVSGPTLARMDGAVLMNRANHGTMDWDAREKRPPNYTCLDGDSWLGLNPRNGEGRWCSDMVYAGGIWSPKGLCYWAALGTGNLAYSHQSEAFATWGNVESWLYTYDPVTFDQVEFSRWSGGIVHGHAVGPDGLVYLLERNQWTSGLYQVDSAIKVYVLESAEPPVIPPTTKQTLTPTNLRAIGGWQMPSNSGLGFVAGGLYVEREGRNLTFFAAGKEGQNTIHSMTCNLDQMGTLGTWQGHWPKATHNWAVIGFHEDTRTAEGMRVSGISRPNPGGPLLCSSWDRYAVFEKAWRGPYMSWVDESGPISAVHTPPRVDGRVPFSRGFCNIPQWFADAHLQGRTFGVGHGGYYSSQGASLGPTLFVCDTPEPGATMIQNPLVLLQFNAWVGDPNNAERRPGDYSNGLWLPEPDANGVGYWLDDVDGGPVWIDTPTLTGLCYWSQQSIGPRDYNLQNETFSLTTKTRLYVYSPETIAAVASGQLAHNQARAKYYEWDNPFDNSLETHIWPCGATWDGEYLYVAYKNAGSDQYDTQPVIMAYEVI